MDTLAEDNVIKSIKLIEYALHLLKSSPGRSDMEQIIENLNRALNLIQPQ